MSAPAWLRDQPYAHRGLWAWDGPPENSMAAFLAAREHNLGIELDVRAAADGELIVFHDAKLDRMTGESGPIAARRAADLARVALLQSEERIPRLAEVLTACPQTPLLIEMKIEPGDEERVPRALAALIAGHKGPAAVMSFSAAALAAFAAAAPHVSRGQLSAGLRRGGRDWRASSLDEERRDLALSQPDFLSFAVDVLTTHGRPLADEAAAPLLAWTVRDRAALAAARAGADQIIFEHLPPALVLDAPARL
jgi:glycerophosphoryl diester phosphodiesterase